MKNRVLCTILMSLIVFNSINAQQLYDTISFEDAQLKGTRLMENTNFIIETLADENHTLVINEILASNATINHDESEDSDDWFEVYNFGEVALNLKDYYFSDDSNDPLKWQIEDSADFILEPKSFIVFWADKEPEQGACHTNFKLSSSGEFIGVYTADKTLVDGVTFAEQNTDISYGRFPDGGLDFYHFSTPTPNYANDNQICEGSLTLPVSNESGGIYDSPIQLELKTSEPNCEIYYTLDKTEPTTQSLKYATPLNITETSVIRVRSFKENFIASPILSLSIIVSEELYENPIISIVTDDKYLYGTQGILNGIENVEIPANMEYIKNGKTVYSSGMGVKLHSKKSNKQYSMRFYARSRYGNNWFDYSFFDENSVDKFKRLIIRNSGNDCVQSKWTNTHFRDQFIHRIASDYTNAITSESKPVNVFVNGEFFGLYNLRERIDEYFVESHYPDLYDYDLLERAFGFSGNRNAINGDWEKWDEILKLVDVDKDMSIDSDFDEASELIDIKNFTDYWLTEIIVGNYDWLSNNIKFIVPEEGKAQWIYWDTDHGIGLKYNEYGLPTWNTLEWSLTCSDRAWSTGANNRIVRNFIKNENYKEYFIKRLGYLLNVSYSKENIHPMLDSIEQLYANDICRHIEKWGNDISTWKDNIDYVKEYFTERPKNVIEHATKFFELEEPVTIKIITEPTNAGFIYFDNNKDALTGFNGYLFPDYKYHLAAEPNSGYEFVGWEGCDSTDTEIDLRFSTDAIIKAKFALKTNKESLFISEIFFNSAADYSCGDWLELTNDSTVTKDISSYKIYQNDKLLYEFGNDVILKPSEFIVLAKQLDLFKQVYFDDTFIKGELLDNLQEKSTITIYDKTGKEIRSLSYEMEVNDWPLLPVNSYSYELVKFDEEYINSNNWKISENRFGTPGLNFANTYSFNKPFAKNDTLILKTSQKQELQSLLFNFTDSDGHGFAAVQIHSTNGTTELLYEDLAWCTDEFYNPENFSVQSHGNIGDVTKITYSLVDNSGDKSSNYILTVIDSINNNTFVLDPIMSNNSLSEIIAYPVPAAEFVKLDLRNFNISKLDIKLYNQLGQLVLSESEVNTQSIYKLNVAALNEGIYLLSLDYNKKRYSNKIVISR